MGRDGSGGGERNRGGKGEAELLSAATALLICYLFLHDRNKQQLLKICDFIRGDRPRFTERGAFDWLHNKVSNVVGWKAKLKIV